MRRSRSCSSRYTSLSTSSTYAAMRETNASRAGAPSATPRPMSPERSPCTVIQYDCILRLPARLIAAALPVDSSVNTVALMVAARARTTMVPSANPSLTTSDSAKKRLSIFMERPPGRWTATPISDLEIGTFCPFGRAQATADWTDRRDPQRWRGSRGDCASPRESTYRDDPEFGGYAFSLQEADGSPALGHVGKR